MKERLNGGFKPRVMREDPADWAIGETDARVAYWDNNPDDRLEGFGRRPRPITIIYPNVVRSPLTTK